MPLYLYEIDNAYNFMSPVNVVLDPIIRLSVASRGSCSSSRPPKKIKSWVKAPDLGLLHG